LKGYEATDIVQFGDFFSFTKFEVYMYIYRERDRERGSCSSWAVYIGMPRATPLTFRA
jgi:pyruvate-formate lyase